MTRGRNLNGMGVSETYTTDGIAEEYVADLPLPSAIHSYNQAQGHTRFRSLSETNEGAGTKFRSSPYSNLNQRFETQGDSSWQQNDFYL